MLRRRHFGHSQLANFQEVARLPTRRVSLVVERIEADGPEQDGGPVIPWVPSWTTLQRLHQGQLGPSNGLCSEEVFEPDPRH